MSTITVKDGTTIYEDRLCDIEVLDGLRSALAKDPSRFYRDFALMFYGANAKKSARLIKGATEIYYPGLPHGLTATHQDLVNRDLLAFCRQGNQRSRESAAGLVGAIS